MKNQKFGGTSRPPNATRFSQTRGLSPSIVARFLLLPTLAEEFRTRTSSASTLSKRTFANRLSQYRNFEHFPRTPLVQFLQTSQSSLKVSQSSYNASQSSYNLTSHNIRIRSYLTYIISVSAPNAIMLAVRRTYPNRLSQYRNFEHFPRTPLVQFLQTSQSSLKVSQSSYNASQSSYNLTSHNIRIRSYRTYIISVSAPNAIMLAARRTYPSVVVSLSVCLRQLISIKTHICHICHICHLTNKQNRANKQTDDE